jgi:ABC-type lipoprotein release transport system permease subunit
MGISSIDLTPLMQAVEIEMEPSELQSYLSAVMSQEIVTAKENLRRFGYAGEEDLAEIAIYPKDFEAKDRLCEIIDDYNEDCRLKDEEEKQISYIDTVGLLMSSVTDIINAITYVLVALVAVSLVVSSVMIGVITYISVLERRKEIGILRAIGASRFNVSEVFIAETFITGLASGILGISSSYLLLIPINRILHHFIGEGVQASAYLAPVNAVRLVILSFTLSVIAGLFPAFRAANNDPAESLRTE